MRIVAISDVHGSYEFPSRGEIVLPEGDCLVVAGDLAANGGLGSLGKFTEWIRGFSFKHKVVIAGNHDSCFERSARIVRGMLKEAGVIYLEDSGVEIDGIKFWGSPYTPRFFNYSFLKDRGEEIKKNWDLIPLDTDVLITHGPPHGILDLTPKGEHVGCEELRKRVSLLKNLKVHIFGHIHHSYGHWAEDGVDFFNVSTLGEDYRVKNEPVVFDLGPGKEIPRFAGS